MALTLVIGNKNYSSWSLRPWIAMKAAGIPFTEELVPFGQPLGNPEWKARLRRYTPAGKVPALVNGDVQVWESISIIEYLAEKHPEARLWPADAKARALARTVSAEMHAGFSHLRNHCPMNMRREPKRRALTPAVEADIRRIEDIWTDCRARFGRDGPYLFGRFTAADAMYAPVVVRFHVYGIEVGAAARDYMDAIMALPAWAEWKAAALAEPWIVAEDEVD